MKQGEYSSSSAESKSAPAAASSPAAQHYKCKHCSRQFKTSRARCSHQSTHRMASEMWTKPYGAVLGAVLIHHIPSDDEDEVVVNAPPSNEPQPEPEKENVTNAKTSTAAGSSQPQALMNKAPVLQPELEQPQTRDLLGEWSPMCLVRGEAEGSGSSSELTQLDLEAARVLDEMGDDIDLELKLCSMNNKEVDLELKLGF